MAFIKIMNQSTNPQCNEMGGCRMAEERVEENGRGKTKQRDFFVGARVWKHIPEQK